MKTLLVATAISLVITPVLACEMIHLPRPEIKPGAYAFVGRIERLVELEDEGGRVLQGSRVAVDEAIFNPSGARVVDVYPIEVGLSCERWPMSQEYLAELGERNSSSRFTKTSSISGWMMRARESD